MEAAERSDRGELSSLFFLINFYWRIVALQYCVHFYCIAK